MDRSIKDFESWVSEYMLQKGVAYQEFVENLQQDGDHWEADVYGTDKYVTGIRLKNGQVVHWNCDCPYDHGPICKHVVALLFAVREELVSMVEAPTETTTKSTTDPIAAIIEKLEESELRQLITYLAGRQETVRSHLLTKYAHLLEVVSESQYKQLVQSYIDAHSGGGFLGYRQADQLGDKLYDLVENADSDNPVAEFYLCKALIFQLAEVFQNADDSSGSLGGAMENAFQRLYNLADEDMDTPIEVVRSILEYAIEECNMDIYQGWDWDSNLRFLACQAVRTKEQATKVIEVLDESIAKNKEKKYSNYTIERNKNLKHDLLKQYYSPIEAEQYLQDNLQYSSFRKMALEKAMAEKNYDVVRQLAEEGIILDQEKAPGRVADWKKWLISLSEETGDTASLIEINEELFFSRGEMGYYRKLKEIIPKKEWTTKVDHYIQQFRKREDPRWQATFNRYVANILEEEKRLEELMVEIKKSPALRRLDQYHDLLGKQFTEDYLILYEKLIRHHMDSNTGRSSYVECCRYIDKIVRLDGLDKAKKIVSDWRKQYPRRRAMIEELARYKW